MLIWLYEVADRDGRRIEQLFTTRSLSEATAAEYARRGAYVRRVLVEENDHDEVAATVVATGLWKLVVERTPCLEGY